MLMSLCSMDCVCKLTQKYSFAEVSNALFLQKKQNLCSSGICKCPGCDYGGNRRYLSLPEVAHIDMGVIAKTASLKAGIIRDCFHAIQIRLRLKCDAGKDPKKGKLTFPKVSTNTIYHNSHYLILMPFF